jgi:4-coumarate--CoA ligase
MSSCRIYESPFPSPAVPTDASVSQFLVQHNPDDVLDDKIILSDFEHANNFLTFGSLRTKSALGASGLKSVLGLCEGDVISIYGQNSVNWALLAHSVLWSGACFRCVNL